MQAFLEAFAATIRDDEHVALVLDGAGWHASKRLRVPSNITLVPLPPYWPELNPVERVWLYLKQRFLLAAPAQRLSGHRRGRIESLEAIVQADWTYRVAHVIPVDHEGQTISSTVSRISRGPMAVTSPPRT